MINEDLLLSFGAVLKTYEPEDLIFSEGEIPAYFFLIAKGKIKLNNYNEGGKEFIQGILSNGHTIAVSALFTGKPYPINAIAIEESDVWRIPKTNYFEVLHKHPEFYIEIISRLSEHLHYKFVMTQSMAFESPSQKLLTILNINIRIKPNIQCKYSLQGNNWLLLPG